MWKPESTLLVPRFPRNLRQRLHAQAALEGRRLNELVIALLEKAVAQKPT
jgi:predicted HicB family RNase H-like nuclease